MRLYRMLETIDGCPAPVVCCVHGYALGGGSGLVACADIAVAWPDAVFGFTEVRLGIIPAVISPFVLAKIGSAARRYFVTGERFDAEAALRIGLVSEVSEDAGERAEAIVGDILAGGPIATRAAKRLVLDRPVGEETAHIAATRRTSDEGQDGLRAFLERRPPGWLLVAAFVEVLLEAQEREDEDREQRSEPYDDRRADPGADPADGDTVGEDVGDEERDERRDQRDAAERGRRRTVPAKRALEERRHQRHDHREDDERRR